MIFKAFLDNMMQYFIKLVLCTGLSYCMSYFGNRHRLCRCFGLATLPCVIFCLVKCRLDPAGTKVPGTM